VLVENGNSVLELAAKPVVESERDDCWSVHSLSPQQQYRIQLFATCCGSL